MGRFYVSYEEALSLILDRGSNLGFEVVDLLSARGRFLAEDLCADRDWPEVPLSAMDGYAVRGEDLERFRKFRLIAEAPAGTKFSGFLGKAEAVKVFTGSPVPREADTVVPVEYAREGNGFVEFLRVFPKGSNVRQVGEDYSKGRTLLRKGDLLTPSEIALIASIGRSSVKVYRKPVVGIVATGNEVVEPESSVTSLQVRNANAYSLYALVEESGAVPVYLGIVKDSLEEVRKLLDRALADCDVVVTSGGVSTGDYDFVKDVIDEIGVEKVFYKVKVKPGKPVLFGERMGKFIFALPGFPVSTIVAFSLFVFPFLRKLSGARREFWFKKRVKGKLLSGYSRKKAERTEFVRCNYVYDLDRGEYLISPLTRQGSGVLSSLKGRKALMVVPAGVKEFPPGDCVEVILVKE